MHLISQLFALLKDPGPFIAAGGYPLLAAIIFIETGAMFPLLPGDSLLVVAGLFAARGDLNLLYLNLLLIPMAIAGDAVSYLIGARIGPKLFSRPKSRLWNPEHVQAAHAFYEKHGGKAIILARFVPIVRTFVPVVAGVAGMPYRRFASFNMVGGAAWVLSMTSIGYFLVGIGNKVLEGLFPGKNVTVEKNIEKIIIAVIFLSIVPILLEYARAKFGKRPAESK
jgi:membrane-associated protein